MTCRTTEACPLSACLPSSLAPAALSSASSTVQRQQQVSVPCQRCLHTLLPHARGQQHCHLRGSFCPPMLHLLAGVASFHTPELSPCCRVGASNCPIAGDCGRRIARHSLPPRNPLAHSRAQHVTAMIPCCSVPGANDRHIAGGGYGKRDPKEWCTRIFLDAEMQVVYVAMRGSVYGFRVRDAERIYDWEDIHEVAAADFLCGWDPGCALHAVCVPASVHSSLCFRPLQMHRVAGSLLPAFEMACCLGCACTRGVRTEDDTVCCCRMWSQLWCTCARTATSSPGHTT